ncbi:hypothetical protein GX51_05903 [Blastomyces parvus]|uniref:Ubiquitin-like domain-containing protein n=1 Tax=Blastomyces parvus TaxID=2060905 RepID=A0A2B7WTS7_9EURO|nr:hypothetical protein GX51_05903 [Blastomyces parvus]
MEDDLGINLLHDIEDGNSNADTAESGEFSYSRPVETVRNWLRDDDMLPRDFPQARVMIFGYRSEWKGQRPSDVTSAEVAKRLLDSLARARKGFEDRPVVFVAHCVGGLVLARELIRTQSLLTAYHDEMHDNKWSRLFSSTLGIVFMGTPFRGAHGALANGKILSAAQRQIDSLKNEDERREARTIKRILEILTPGNEILFSLMSDFLSIENQLMPQMLLKEILVPRESATLDRVESLLMETDHFNLNKFRGRSEEYRIVVNKMQAFLSEEAYSIYYTGRRAKMMRINPSLAHNEGKEADVGADPDFGIKYCSDSHRTSENRVILKRKRTNNHDNGYHQARSLYLNLRMQIERQQPVYFMDALGRVTPFHLEFIRSKEAFVAVLKDNFRDYGPATEMIEMGKFALYDVGTNRDIDLTRKWETIFRPGQGIAMCMVFKRAEVQSNFCPSCKNDFPRPTADAVQCPTCGTIFRRITDLTSDTDTKIDSRRIFNDFSTSGSFRSEPSQLQELKRLEPPPAVTPHARQDDVQDDMDETITLFRNIRIISTPPIERSSKVWCSVRANFWHYNDHSMEKRTGWCFVEKGDTVVLECHQDQNVVFFIRKISPRDDSFSWGSADHEFFWRESGYVGGWRFTFQSREDALVIWDYIRCRSDVQLKSHTSPIVPRSPDELMAPLQVVRHRDRDYSMRRVPLPELGRFYWPGTFSTPFIDDIEQEQEWDYLPGLPFPIYDVERAARRARSRRPFG